MTHLPHLMRNIFCRAVNKLYFYRKFSGEREKYVFIQQSKLANI
jgi:hypothetical protein